ncbi:MAG: hypothetical protein PVH76_13115 [Myxococcales bacterium]
MRRSARLLLALFVVGCSLDPKPARLHVVNLVERAPSVRVRICAEAGEDDCRETEVAHGSIGAWMSLSPGAHRFQLSTAEGNLTDFRFGLGRDGVYALVLYGIAEPPVRTSWRSRAKQLLGGIDQPLVAGYQVGHRMVRMQSPGSDTPARLRLANMSPGATKIAADLDLGVEHRTLSPVPYGSLGESVEAGRNRGTLAVSFADSPLTLVSRKLALPPGSITVVYVGAFDRTVPLLVVDQWSGQ